MKFSGKELAFCEQTYLFTVKRRPSCYKVTAELESDGELYTVCGSSSKYFYVLHSLSKPL